MRSLIPTEKGNTPWLLLTFVTVLASGCFDNRPKRVPIAGTVLIDGKPLKKGNILFVPEGTRPSSGRIGEQGQFELTCFDGEDGAVLGVHRVQVSSNTLTGPSPRWHTPRKYADFRTSGLTYEVTEAEDDVVIELTWNGKERPQG